MSSAGVDHRDPVLRHDEVMGGRGFVRLLPAEKEQEATAAAELQHNGYNSLGSAHK